MTDRTSFPEIPGYRLEQVVGKGSMATVYRAHQIGMNRTVAVKVLRADVLPDPKLSPRLLREARLAARFNHPHIVRAHDAGVHEGTYYFVMELVNGLSVRELVARDGPMSEDRAIHLVTQVAEALNHFQAERIVHRDIKPANILVDEEGAARLADLGLARPNLTGAHQDRERTVGTPNYMSPEQAENPDAVDVRSDLFSLGATLYFMVTGVSPFEAPTIGEVLTRILYEPAESVRARVPELSVELESVIMRLLEKDRDRRYRTPAELLRDLRALIRGDAPPQIEAFARLERRRRRRRELTVIGGGSTVVAVIAIVVATFLRDGTSTAESSKNLSPPRETVKELPDPTLLRPDELIVFAAREGLPPSFLKAVLAGLRRSVDDLFGEAEDDALELAENGRAFAARERILAGLDRRLLERFGVPADQLPVLLAVEVTSRRPGLIEAVEIAVREHEDRIIDDVRERLEVLVDEWGDVEVGPYPEAATREKELAAVVPTGNAELSSAARDRLESARSAALVDYRRRARTTVLRTVRDIDGARRERRLGTARRRVGEELARHPERIDEALKRRFEDLLARVDRDERLCADEAAAWWRALDRLATPGHPEWKDRRYGPARDQLANRLADFTASSDELGVAGKAIDGLRSFLATLDGTLALLEKIPDSIEVGANLSITTRNGQVVSGKVTEASAKNVVIAAGAPLPVRVAMRDMDPAWLIARVKLDDAAAHRIEALLRYSDDDLLASILVSPSDDPVIQHLAGRARAGRGRILSIVTPEDESAFAAWEEVVAAALGGRHLRARDLADTFFRHRKHRKTGWYRGQRERIDRLREELETRAALDRAFRGRPGRTEILDLELRRVRRHRSFDDASDRRDFTVLPPGARVTRGVLRMAEPSEGVRPQDISAVTLDFPVDLASSPFDLVVIYRPHADRTRPPRFLAVSMFGQHVGFLSRLEQRAAPRSEPLHGLDPSLVTTKTYGIVAAWQGRLGDYEPAFAARRDRDPVMVFEPGRSYVVRLVLDRKERRLVVTVNGRMVLERKGIVIEARNNRIEVRASDPYDLLEMSVAGSVKTR